MVYREIWVAKPDIPRVNVGGGWNFYIKAQADNQDTAWELVQYMSAPQQQKDLALNLGYLPTRSELYDDEDVVDALPAVKLDKEAIQSTTTPPVSPYYSDMSLVMSEQFNANIRGAVSPEEAAEQIQSQLDTIVSKGG